MPDDHNEKPHSGNPLARSFQTTRWSMILDLKEGSEEDRHSALEGLARNYWFPLYAHVRRKGLGHTDAEDRVQGFFAQMLARDAFEMANADKGRFRTFLLSSFDNYLKNEWRRDQAEKRGGGEKHLSIDHEDFSERYERDTIDSALTPDRAYNRQWAENVIQLVLERLERNYRDAGKEALFTAFKPFLIEHKGAVPYAEVAENVGMPVNSVRTAIHRFRQRYARAFREEIAHTVDDPEDVENEIRELLSALAA